MSARKATLIPYPKNTGPTGPQITGWLHGYTVSTQAHYPWSTDRTLSLYWSPCVLSTPPTLDPRPLIADPHRPPPTLHHHPTPIPDILTTQPINPSSDSLFHYQVLKHPSQFNLGQLSHPHRRTLPLCDWASKTWGSGA